MELSEEESNFMKIVKIVLDIVPKYLRKCFIKQWDKRFPMQKWQSNIASGNILFNSLPTTVKCTQNKMHIKCIEKMRTGNEGTWDTTVLGFAILDAGLKLIDENTPEEKEIKEGIFMIREIRNTCFGHSPTMSCSSAAFAKAIVDLKSAPGNIINDDAKKEINEVIGSYIMEKMIVQLIQQLKEEERENEKFLKEIKDDVNRLQTDVEDLQKVYQHQPTPTADDSGDQSRRELDDLKAKYIDLYEKHQLHIVDKNSKIQLKEVSIDDFAVKLTICSDSSSAEARRLMESPTCIAGQDIELSELIDKKCRVTFIRGIAGMGKSVLSKQLTCGWAQNKMYKDFKVCAMFECRELNIFQATKGTEFKRHELLEAFVKTKFGYDFGDGKRVLFVVDGLDELYDVNTDVSIIKQLFSRAIYPLAKIIITGRPIIEKNLERYGEIGGLRKVEIKGFNDEQIKEYIRKFPCLQGRHIDLNNAKDSSSRFFPIMRIPQFLNTFCCIAVLLKGEAICNGAELYCWTIYLLLKQHADRQNSRKTLLISEIFSEYSKELLTLGEVCHRLLSEKKIILLKEEIEALLEGCEKGKEFIDSLFVDVSDNFARKKEFKHLTLLEFLSAFHICCMENCVELVKESLQKGFLEVAIFSCQLISGYGFDGIIREMLKVNATKLDKIDPNGFCHDIVKVLHDCQLDKKTVFTRSLDVILSFLDQHLISKEVALSTVKMLQIEGISLIGEESKKLYSIYEHLHNKCKCDENEIREAFEYIHLYWFDANELKRIHLLKYFGNVYGITLYDMRLNVNATRHELELLCEEKCKKVLIWNCELQDNECERRIYASNVNHLMILKCRLNNVNSLINAFHWATSSSSSSSELSSYREFVLRGIKFEDGWWEELVMAIEEERKTNGSVKFGKLIIGDCTPKMSTHLQMRVIRFVA